MEYFNPKAFERLYDSEEHSFWFNARNTLIVYFLNKYFNQPQNDTKISYLEIGCGTGYVLQAVHNAFPSWQVAGSELFEEGLTFARQRLSGVDFIQLNALEMQEKERYFIIGAYDVLEHIQDDETVMKNMYTAIQENGGGY